MCSRVTNVVNVSSVECPIRLSRQVAMNVSNLNSLINNNYTIIVYDENLFSAVLVECKIRLKIVKSINRLHPYTFTINVSLNDSKNED